MDPTTIGVVAVAIVLGIDLLLIVGLVVLKAVHRHRRTRYDERRARYVVALSRHLASGDKDQPFDLETVEDEAFLDAVIDLRNVVSGVETETLARAIDMVGMARHQEVRLRRRRPIGHRLRAAVALAEMGEESTAPLLIEYLQDPEPEIRIQCARGLGRIKHSAAIDAILERFSVEEPWVRARFADTLVGFGAKATWPLIAYITVNLGHDENVGVIEAIRVLGTIGDPEAGPTLASIIRRTTDPEVALAAIEALGMVGGPLSIRPLKYTLRSPDWRLRAKSATSLGQIGDPSVNLALARSLEDANWWVRRNSAASLAGLPGGTALLFEAIGLEDAFARDAAVEALAGTGALTAARDRIEAGVGSDDDHRLIEYVSAQVGTVR